MRSSKKKEGSLALGVKSGRLFHAGGAGTRRQSTLTAKKVRKASTLASQAAASLNAQRPHASGAFNATKEGQVRLVMIARQVNRTKAYDQETGEVQCRVQ
jgi:hypothetical protein